MAVSKPFVGVIANQALLPQAVVGKVPAFYAVTKMTSMLPVATGQNSVAKAGTAISLLAIKKNISVLR